MLLAADTKSQHRTKLTGFQVVPKDHNWNSPILCLLLPSQICTAAGIGSYLIMHSWRMGSMSRWVWDRISSCPGHGRQWIGGRLAECCVWVWTWDFWTLIHWHTSAHTHTDTHTSTDTCTLLHTHNSVHTLTMCIATLGMPVGALAQWKVTLCSYWCHLHALHVIFWQHVWPIKYYMYMKQERGL